MRSMLFLVDQRVERVVLRFERFDLCLVHWCHSLDRKSTRLNSSHLVISYAVFCLKKKNAVPLVLKTADRSLSIPPATAIFEVRHFGGHIENVCLGRVRGGCLLNQSSACRVNHLN